MDFLLDSPGNSPNAPLDSSKNNRKVASIDRANEESPKQAHTLSSNMSEPEEMPEPIGGNSELSDLNQ